MKEVIKDASAYLAGEATQISILKQGITAGTLKQIRNIVLNHPDEVLTVYIEGLLGVGTHDKFKM